MKTTSPVSSDWQISSHFWASVDKQTMPNSQGRSEKVGWPGRTAAPVPSRKLLGQLWVLRKALGVELGLKVPAVSLISLVTLGKLSDLSEPQFLIPDQ